MDINFNISQINENINEIRNVTEKINRCLSDIKNLFSDTLENFDIIKKEIVNTESIIIDLINYANYILDIINVKLTHIPEDKKLKEKPVYQNINNEQIKKQYEILCKTIDKENSIINQKNNEFHKSKIDLNKLKVELQNLLQRLEVINNKCSHYKTYIDNYQNELLLKKSETESQLKQSLKIVNQTYIALNKTYSCAEKLVLSSNDKVYGDLYTIFKLKTNNKINKIKFQKRKEYFYDEEMDKTNNIVVMIKTRKIDEFLKELDDYNLSLGDIVKIPSYNLFNLGNDNILKEMKCRGFEIIENNSSIILEDSTISWVKKW